MVKTNPLKGWTYKALQAYKADCDEIVGPPETPWRKWHMEELTEEQRQQCLDNDPEWTERGVRYEHPSGMGLVSHEESYADALIRQLQSLMKREGSASR